MPSFFSVVEEEYACVFASSSWLVSVCFAALLNMKLKWSESFGSNHGMRQPVALGAVFGTASARLLLALLKQFLAAPSPFKAPACLIPETPGTGRLLLLGFA